MRTNEQRLARTSRSVMAFVMLNLVRFVRDQAGRLKGGQLFSDPQMQAIRVRHETRTVTFTNDCTNRARSGRTLCIDRMQTLLCETT